MICLGLHYKLQNELGGQKQMSRIYETKSDKLQEITEFPENSRSNQFDGKSYILSYRHQQQSYIYVYNLIKNANKFIKYFCEKQSLIYFTNMQQKYQYEIICYEEDGMIELSLIIKLLIIKY
ncbi:Hypothetical_protein [Hexamita inflata]|uniref:Hypothetical_protein n=1 Tax=Hexamita inflata TaxID=28002 RepID=A0AA86PS61_9EUKA|nr:Hypothetical protein HINF_LOCUS17858 [Hexamita inflata]CAI9940550.1 Hypothetical protein HINF_LOCUS28195 [Hexamita inflata]